MTRQFSTNVLRKAVQVFYLGKLLQNKSQQSSPYPALEGAVLYYIQLIESVQAESVFTEL